MNRRDFIKTAVGTVAALPAAATLAVGEIADSETTKMDWRAGYGSCPEVFQHRRWDILTRVVGMIDERLPGLTPNHREHLVSQLFQAYAGYMECPALLSEKNFTGIDTYIYTDTVHGPTEYCIRVARRYVNPDQGSTTEFDGETIELDYSSEWVTDHQFVGSIGAEVTACPEWEKICEQNEQARMFRDGREFGEDLFEET